MSLRVPFAIVVTLTVCSVSQQAFAKMGHSMKGMHSTSMAPAAATMVNTEALANAVVKQISLTKKTVTLTHGALPNGMPAMTMIYQVKQAARLETMSVGQKIRFAGESVDGGMTVTRFESMK